MELDAHIVVEIKVKEPLHHILIHIIFLQNDDREDVVSSHYKPGSESNTYSLVVLGRYHVQYF